VVVRGPSFGGGKSDSIPLVHISKNGETQTRKRDFFRERGKGERYFLNPNVGKKNLLWKRKEKEKDLSRPG